MTCNFKKYNSTALLCFTIFIAACNNEPQNKITNLDTSNSTILNRPSLKDNDYISENAYSLNVVYFVPTDRSILPNYQERLSKFLRWGQEYYRSNMIRNGFENTFGLSVKRTDTSSVRITVIHGMNTASNYTYKHKGTIEAEIKNYFAANPTIKTGEHYLVISSVNDVNHADAPFYGLGKFCYALDYADFNIKYLGQDNSKGRLVAKWFGGMMHELAHGLNLPHSHETNTEDRTLGKNLLGTGNYVFGSDPTFINRAGAAILDKCQLFSKIKKKFYNASDAALTSLEGKMDKDNFVVSGTFSTTDVVTDVNIYQDPDARDDAYDAVAWSKKPEGNSFRISMPLSELQTPSGGYVLRIGLIMNNGNVSNLSYPYVFNNGRPVINFNFKSLTNGIYEIVSARSSGGNLNVNGNELRNKAKIGVYTDTNGKNQRWRIMEVGNAYYKIAPQNANKKVLEIINKSNFFATGVQINASNNISIQQWRILPSTSGYYKILPSNSPTFFLSANDELDGRDNLKLLVDNGTSGQQWILKKIK